jgi:hypothetical protein
LDSTPNVFSGYRMAFMVAKIRSQTRAWHESCQTIGKLFKKRFGDTCRTNWDLLSEFSFQGDDLGGRFEQEGTGSFAASLESRNPGILRPHTQFPKCVK